MKNHNEMYQSLLSRYEAYQEEKIQRKRIVRRIVPIAACFCLSVALGCGYWFHFRHIPTIPALPETTEEQTTEPPVTHPTETEANADPAETIMTDTVIPTETAPLPTDPTEPTAVTAATSTPEPTNPTQPSQAPHTQTTTVPPRETTAPVDPTETAPATDPTEPEPTESSPIEPQPTEPQTPTEALIDGFFVENLDGCKRIVCTETMPAKTGTLRPYAYIADGFNLVSVNENDGVNEYLLQSGMESPRPPEF
nr:hypothetical protein [Oscillospiraceae bacterium]